VKEMPPGGGWGRGGVQILKRENHCSVRSDQAL